MLNSYMVWDMDVFEVSCYVLGISVLQKFV